MMKQHVVLRVPVTCTLMRHMRQNMSSNARATGHTHTRTEKQSNEQEVDDGGCVVAALFADSNIGSKSVRMGEVW